MSWSFKKDNKANKNENHIELNKTKKYMQITLIIV